MNDALCLSGFYNGSSPQSWDDEVLPIESALRQIDDRLRLVWNPQAFITTPGVIDVYGRPVPPTYAARWQVVIAGASDGALVALHTVGSEVDPTKPYRAVGPWLVEFMQQWDAANVHQAEAMRQAIAESDAIHQRDRALEHEVTTERTLKALRDHHGIRSIRSVVPVQLT